MRTTSKQLLTATELAEALAVSLSTVRRLTRDGQIPVVRVRSAVRYEFAAVVEALGRFSQAITRWPPSGEC